MDASLLKPSGPGQYRMRDGRKVTIIGLAWGRWCGKTADCESVIEIWRRDGSYDTRSSSRDPHHADIIAKWNA